MFTQYEMSPFNVQAVDRTFPEWKISSRTPATYQNQMIEELPSTIEGMLEKQGKTFKLWKQQFVALKSNLLCFYKHGVSVLFICLHVFLFLSLHCGLCLILCRLPAGINAVQSRAS